MKFSFDTNWFNFVSFLNQWNGHWNQVEIYGTTSCATNKKSDNLICPVCQEEFENTPENIRLLAVHVDDHFIKDLKCPICNISYEIANQREYEIHVNVS